MVSARTQAECFENAPHDRAAETTCFHAVDWKQPNRLSATATFPTLPGTEFGVRRGFYASPLAGNAFSGAAVSPNSEDLD